MSVVIKDIAAYLPSNRVSNEDIQSRISLVGGPVDISLEKIFGIKERRFGAPEEQVSDMACNAAKPILARNSENIDLLIFAAASADVIEPATSSIIQSKLGLDCPCLDIKNACNSFTSAMQTASAYIESGMYENILLVNGEKLSTVVKYDIEDEASFTSYLSGFTLGDGGCAMLMCKGSKREVKYQRFATWGQHWELCTIKGGGSLAYRDWEKYYFNSESTQLRDACLVHGIDFIQQCFKESGYTPEEIDVVVPHQVSKSMPELIASRIGIEQSKWVNTFEMYGNLAAASIPIALEYAMSSGQIVKGSRVLLLGFAAGISLSFQVVEF